MGEAPEQVSQNETEVKVLMRMQSILNNISSQGRNQNITKDQSTNIFSKLNIPKDIDLVGDFLVTEQDPKGDEDMKIQREFQAIKSKLTV